MQEEFTREEILEAAGLAMGRKTRTLEEDCVRQVARNRFLRAALPAIVEKVLGAREPRVIEWQNSDGQGGTEQAAEEMPMIDTLSRPFVVGFGGKIGDVREVLARCRDLSGEPTPGFGAAVAGWLVSSGGTRAALRLGELARGGQASMRDVREAADEFAKLSGPSRGMMLRACMKLAEKMPELSRSMGFLPGVRAGIIIRCEGKKAQVLLAWSCGPASWAEDLLFEVGRDELFACRLEDRAASALSMVRPPAFQAAVPAA